MKRKPTEKETIHLRALVGEDGTRPHYFEHETPAAREAREAKKRKTKTAATSAAQVAEMRSVTGTKAQATKGVDAQVAEMRRVAAEADLLPEV